MLWAQQVVAEGHSSQTRRGQKGRYLWVVEMVNVAVLELRCLVVEANPKQGRLQVVRKQCNDVTYEMSSSSHAASCMLVQALCFCWVG